jgi:hypothetical protein
MWAAQRGCTGKVINVAVNRLSIKDLEISITNICVNFLFVKVKICWKKIASYLRIGRPFGGPGLNLSGFRCGPGGGSCERSNGTWAFIECSEVLDSLKT